VRVLKKLARIKGLRGGEKSGRPNPAWIKESSQRKKENVR